MDFPLAGVELPVRLRFDRSPSDDELYDFCVANAFLRVERDANGEILVMSPTGLEASSWNSEVITDLTMWARHDGRGKVFDSNGGFTLPDRSMRSPDAAWVSWGRWNLLPAKEQKRFGKVVPEFVVELRSESDRLGELQKKMTLWTANGVDVAWLVDPQRKIVEIHRPGDSVEIYQNPTSVQGDGPVLGFELVMSRIWS